MLDYPTIVLFLAIQCIGGLNMLMAKRRPGGYEVDRTATTRMISQHRLSNRVPHIAYSI